ncbi:MAG: precorrin-8X methylmutase [Atopobiaceae bacterium]|nr:precorrin-8X methylmutase [Atopobiaceae bacterium]
MSERIHEPARIESQSMQIIENELRARGITPPLDEGVVLRRVIHTTADFDYAQNLVFVNDPVPAAVAALRRAADAAFSQQTPGVAAPRDLTRVAALRRAADVSLVQQTPGVAAPRGRSGIAAPRDTADATALCDAATIVTDTTMAKAGISKPACSCLGVEVRCHVGDADVAQAAREAHETRAVMAMRKALAECESPIVAVGNAPTALFELCDRMREGARPTLVVAVPVGFVNVVEAKEETLRCCEELKVPAIVARGRKGGSTVATAIINALLYEATNMRDPRTRA